jgi:hypothetical protein
VLVTGIAFGEFKALVNRAAHLRELVGDRAWQITPRSPSPSTGGTGRPHADGRHSELVAMGAASGTLTTVALDVPLSAAPAPAPAQAPAGDPGAPISPHAPT